MRYIDALFRQYAEEHYGKDKANTFTDMQIEEARCIACEELVKLTKAYGRQEHDKVKELFYKHLV